MLVFAQGGDLFQSHAQALVNPVNCVGVMGRGLAAEFKRRFPAYFKEYARLCQEGQMQPGRVRLHLCEAPAPLQYIISFPTKEHWRNPSRIEWIEQGLRDLARQIELHALQSVALPALGCGLGGLDYWTQVRPLLTEILGQLKTQTLVRVYDPHETQ